MRMIWSSRFCYDQLLETNSACPGAGVDGVWGMNGTYLEAFILKHTLDGGILSRGRQFGLKNNTE